MILNNFVQVNLNNKKRNKKIDKAMSNLKTSCHSCNYSHCCHNPNAIHVFKDELAEIKSLITQKHIENFKKDNSICHFLENGKCSVYASRPRMCATHYVVSNPNHCSQKLLFGHETQILSKVEIMAKAGVKSDCVDSIDIESIFKAIS